MSRNTFFTLAAALVFAGSARAQLIWQSYNTSGSRVSSDAATYDSGTSSYSFSIPAGAIHTFVTTNFVPVSFSAGQTKTVTFTMTATGGFGPSGTPVQNKRFIAYGLFDYGATPPGAMGNFTDDKGLWTDSYQQASGIAAEVFGGTSTTANLLSYASATQLGAAIGPSSGAVGQFTDNSATDVTFRIVMNGAGTSSSIGTGTATNVAGAWYTDQATGGTAFNRTIYSAGTAAVAGALNFNEFAFMFSNSTGGSVTRCGVFQRKRLVLRSTALPPSSKTPLAYVDRGRGSTSGCCCGVARMVAPSAAKFATCTSSTSALTLYGRQT